LRTPAAPTFTAVDSAAWLAALRKYGEKAENAKASESSIAVRRNPAVKLLEFSRVCMGLVLGRELGRMEVRTEVEVERKREREGRRARWFSARNRRRRRVGR